MYKILLIEDNPDDIVVIRRFLKGYEIDEAHTGAEGKEKIKGEGFDCLLIDYRLPDTNGLEILKEIREISPIPAIILTGIEDERLIAGGVKLGIDNFLIKGEINAETLCNAINSAILSQKGEEFLAKTEGIYENLISAMNEGLFAVDIHEIITFTNEKLEEMLKAPSTSLLGKNILKIMDEEQYDIFKKACSRFSPFSFELSLIRQDGSCIPALISQTPLFRKDGVFNGFLCVVTDLSKIKEMEARLIETERLITASRIAQEAAHDIRNPLSTIIAGLYLLKKFVRGKEREERIIKQTEDACHRINLYINDLLNFSRPLCLNLRKIQINALIDEFLETLLLEKLKGVEIKVDLYPEPLSVLADPERLKQVLFNLLRNSIDFMPNGGTITIKTEKREKDVLISISDTGEGIKEEDINKIFSPFFTTKGRGIGLGLSIVKRVIDAHGGKISVESKKGEGTTFFITLSAYYEQGE